MEKYSLFIDESGTPYAKSRFSKTYVLCGCSVADEKKRQLKIYADQIKFKYWGRTDIVFHSREIAKNLNDFEIFKDNPELKEEFLKDLFQFLYKAPVILFPIIIDKEEAKRHEWDQEKIIRETTKTLLLNFILLLLSKKGSSGHITIESANAEKDKYYLEYFSYFISPHVKELNVDQKKMQKTLTSLSFVTKNNNDIEEQIADLFAFASICKYAKDYKGKEFPIDSYQLKIISALEQKLFTKPENARNLKMKYYNFIQPFYVLPEREK
jgi:hypothetical protein